MIGGRDDDAVGRHIPETGSLPEFLRDSDWINPILFPPLWLIAAAVQGAMVRAAERHGELIAHSSTKGGWLRKPEVMGIRRSPFAKETWLRGHELKMRAVAVAARLFQRQHALIHG